MSAGPSPAAGGRRDGRGAASTTLRTRSPEHAGTKEESKDQREYLLAFLQIHHQAVMTRDEDVLEEKRRISNLLSHLKCYCIQHIKTSSLRRRVGTESRRKHTIDV